MTKRHYRSVWVSDVHLCTKDCQAEALYAFLDGLRCDYLYLVGDIIDIWALQRRWHWPKQYNEVLHKLLKRSRKGSKVTFIPGNHDDLFRNFIGYTFGDVEILEHTYHETADGRKFLVLHGDEFDTVVQYHTWLSKAGSMAYRYLIMLNRLVNTVRRAFGWPYWSLSGVVKRRVKQAVNFMTRYEEILTREAKRQEVDGVICGHIHDPKIIERDGILYCNTGDWVENCSALVEHEDGTLEIVYWHEELAEHERSQREAAVPTNATPTLSLTASGA